MPLAVAAIGAASSLYAANRNAAAARSAANASRYTPYNVSMDGLGSATYNGNNINLTGQASPWDPINSQLLGLSGYSLDQFTANQANPYGNTSMLSDAYDQSNNYQGFNPSLDIGANGLFGLGAQAMGQLGSFDPNQAAMDYTNKLRATAAPQEQLAAANMADSLFAGGRLGTTGGQGMFGQLINQQNQADIQRQIAGMQYGQQAQMNLANMGSGLMGQGFDMSTSLNNMDYSRAQDRFNRAFQTFGGINAANQGYIQNFSNLSSAAQSYEQQRQQQLMDMARLGGSVGSQATAANSNAAQTLLAGQVNRNVTNQGAFQSFLDAYAKQKGY